MSGKGVFVGGSGDGVGLKVGRGGVFIVLATKKIRHRARKTAMLKITIRAFDFCLSGSADVSIVVS